MRQDEHPDVYALLLFIFAITEETLKSGVSFKIFFPEKSRKIMAVDQNTSKYSKTQSSVHRRSWCGS